MLDKIKNDEAIVICKKALNNWGFAIQKVVAMEELSELVLALSCALRNQQNNIEEEVADVEIMCSQLRLIFDNYVIDHYKDMKLNRLKGVVW